MDFFYGINLMMKGIYLHGYQGFVTEEKKAFLEKFGDVYAPHTDYDQNPTILFQLIEKFKNEELDFVSGTSLGGILAYHLAIKLEVPCLLLNPAVTAMGMIKDFLPEHTIGKSSSKYVNVIIGEKDDVVDPKLQLDFFNHIKSINHHIEIIKNKNLGHFVPLDVFEESFKQFKEKIL